MLHRAVLGSFERFTAILLEHYAGHLPLWLAPVQVVIANITDQQNEYVANIAKKLKNYGFRVHKDLRNEKIGFKIREHTIARVPYFIIVGEKEVATQTISVRVAQGKQTEGLSLDDFVGRLQSEIASRRGDNN
jgi:threonyl-tRNA synthetase